MYDTMILEQITAKILLVSQIVGIQPKFSNDKCPVTAQMTCTSLAFSST